MKREVGFWRRFTVVANRVQSLDVGYEGEGDKKRHSCSGSGVWNKW
jgi:hypothetical protein